MRHLLEQEDTDRNYLITIDDQGPKVSFYAVHVFLAVNKTYSRISLWVYTVAPNSPSLMYKVSTN